MVVVGLICYFYGKPVINATGGYDIFTELIQKCNKREDMEQLRSETVDAFNGKYVSKTSEEEDLEELHFDADDGYAAGDTEALKAEEVNPEQTNEDIAPSPDHLSSDKENLTHTDA
jgi:hypothetical protein